MKNLNTSNWLDHCADETRRRLNERSRSTRHSKGMLIHQSGDPAHELYFIKVGTVRFGATNEGGKELIVRDLGPGEWFGFIGCFGSGFRPNHAYSLTDTTLYSVGLRDIEDIGRSDPNLWRAIAGILAIYVDHFYKIYEDAVFLPLEKRLETALRKLCVWQGASTLKISQGELAAILGVTKEAVGVNLNLLKNRGQVELGYRSIILLDEKTT